MHPSLSNSITALPNFLRFRASPSLSFIMGSASPDDSFCLKWNDFHTSVTSSFADLRAESDLFDITLVCEGGKNLQAHRIILSACSLVFKRLIKSAKNAKEPTILLWDVKPSDMEALLK